MNVKEIVEKMTLEEKISICTGADFWKTKEFAQYGIPAIFMCDGPSGLRKQENASDMLGVNRSRKATAFPAACTMANSWDEQMEELVGKSIGQQARNQKVAMVLGPGINIKRNPLCGRNFEYFSEDPLLSGRMGASFIKGLQSEKIACSLKHFACNNQEHNRLISNGVIDERALREIYLKGFEIAVKSAKPRTIMSAYTLVNGIHCSDHKKLLTDILREEWGFDGLVVTDWGGLNNKIKAMEAGNDLCMPGGSDYMEKEVAEAVRTGSLDEKYIDTCAGRIIQLALEGVEALKEDYEADYEKHHQITIKAAENCAVLLKNEKVLPLQKDQKVLVVGALAKNVRYQGAGSSHINPIRIDQPLDCFENAIYAAGCDDQGDTTIELLKEIEEKAQTVDTIVVFAGLPDCYESEGFDRVNILMPIGHIKMIEKAKETGKKVVVVLTCGCVVDCDWEKNADAILFMGLAGEGAGKAVVHLLYGEANPSGKLSESWPMRYEDVNNHSFYGTQSDALYKESIFVGYRYYDKAKVAVRYPFGYGLSYSQFIYHNFHLEGNKVVGEIENNSEVVGKEIVQLYVGLKDATIIHPEKQLKDFVKVELLPHEKKEISFELKDDFFTCYMDGWKVVDGDYIISVASSCQDIKEQLEYHISGVVIQKDPSLEGSWYETLQGEIKDADWEKLLGYHYQPKKLEKGKFTLENTVMELKDYSLVMKIMYKSVEKVVAKGLGIRPDYNNPEFKMMMNSSAGAPLRSMMISGGIKGGIFPGLVEMANGHYIKGIVKMIKG